MSWVENEGASYLSITIDESSFFYEFKTKISEWELVWKSESGLTFKASAFKEEEGSLKVIF